MELDYLNFNYADESAIEKILADIDTEISYCMSNYKIDYDNLGRAILFNPRKINIDNELNQSEFVNPMRKNFANDYLDINVFNDVVKKPDNFNELGAMEQALKTKDAFANMIISDKKIKEKKKNDKIAQHYFDKNQKHIDKTHDYMMFVLKLRADLQDKLNYALTDEEKQSYLKLQNLYTAKFENLANINNNFRNVNDSILSYRAMQDPTIAPAKTQFEIGHDIALAKSLLAITNGLAHNPYKTKAEFNYDLCECYSKLESDKTAIDNMIEIVKAILTKQTSKPYEEDVKRKMFIEDIERNQNHTLNHSGVTVYQFLNEERLRTTSDMFFNDGKMTADIERLAVLQALRLSTISTMEELKDYLIKNRSEIKMEKNKDGKIEITIARSTDSTIALDVKNNKEIETNAPGANGNITYIYDPMTKHLEGYKLAGQSYLFNVNIDKDFTQNLNNEFNLFLGNLEASTNVPLITFFNKEIPVLQSTKGNFDLAKIKDKLSLKINKDVKVDMNLDTSLGTVSAIGIVLKPNVVTASLNAELSTSNYKIKTPSLKSYFANPINDNKSFLDALSVKLAGKYYNFAMDGVSKSIQKFSFTIGDAQNPIVKCPFKIDNNCLQITDAQFFSKFSKEAILNFNNTCKLMHSVITNNQTEIINILSKNADIVSNDFSTMSKQKQLFEVGKKFSNSVGNLLNAIESINKDSAKLSDTVNNIKSEKPLSEKILDTIGTKKNEKIFSLSKDTIIDDAVIEDRLNLILTMPLDDINNRREMINLLGKIKEPEKFYEEFKIAITNADDNSKENISEIYKNVMKARIINITKDKDSEKLYELLKQGNFNKEILEVAKIKQYRNNTVKMLSDINALVSKDNTKNNTLDELINLHKKQYDKFNESSAQENIPKER